MTTTDIGIGMVSLPADVMQILRARKQRTGIPIRTQLVRLVEGTPRTDEEKEGVVHER